MPAARCNYLVVYDNSPQPFSASTLETIIKGEPPKNCTIEGRTILFVSYFPDDMKLKVFEVTQDQIDEELKRIKDKEDEKAARVAAKESG